ncbi:MAG: 4Fe-4S binding protein [Methanobacteriaceae archaeon]|nr:4Fe-4S binding protein [Methanobacteriaceae archaeon]
MNNITIDNVLSKLREIIDASFATIDENGNPQVRIIDIMLIKNRKIYFLTARGKDFYNEILTNPNVAVATLTKNNQMIRINGSVKKAMPHDKWINKIFEENPIMNNVYPGDTREILDPFYIDEAEIEFFDLSQKPIYRKTFLLNKEKETKKGYLITEDCIKCGICQENCPQKSIKELEIQYKIQSENCLHCGLCYEKCPKKAIIKL